MRTAVACTALLALSACGDSDSAPPSAAPATLQLPALHAEPDPIHGGRIMDAQGREVLLRGVNVNSLGEYWAYNPAIPTVYPFTADDADRMSAFGWNIVRLVVSWSRIEPQPGAYDTAYLDQVEATVRLLASRGMYTIVDLHQDAWGATLAGRPDKRCRPGQEPAYGWDGAPGWATLVPDNMPRCIDIGAERETALAVLKAFANFWDDKPAADGIGIRTRYAQMLGHVASRFAPLDAVAGYDLMNEPNAYLTYEAKMVAMYADAIVAIRAAERAAGAPRRLVFFEPSIAWNLGVGLGIPVFAYDDQVVYAPHVYHPPAVFEALYASMRTDAAQFGGAPVVVGEWWCDPRNSDPICDQEYALQNRFRTGETLWLWHAAIRTRPSTRATGCRSARGPITKWIA